MIPLFIKALRELLKPCVGGQAERVLIGHPGLMEKEALTHNGASTLNLFFYRIEPSEHPAGATDTDPIYLRLFCLITALGIGSDEATAGEVDLVLLASVMDTLHQSPILVLKDSIIDEDLAALQIVPTPLTPDELNKIWSTQHNVDYRPSLAYELAVLPASQRPSPPTARKPDIVVVGVTSTMAFAPPPPKELGEVSVQADDDTWTPQLAFVDTQRKPSFTDAALVKEGAVTIRVVAVGKMGEAVTLRYARWGKDLHWALGTAPSPLTVQESAIQAGKDCEFTTVTLPVAPGNQQLLVWAERALNGAVYAGEPRLVSVHDPTVSPSPPSPP